MCTTTCAWFPAGARRTAWHAAITGPCLGLVSLANSPGCPGFPQNPGPMCFGMRRPLRDCRRAAPISSSARFQFADLDVSEGGSPIGIGREWAFSDLTYREPLLGPQRGPHLSPPATELLDIPTASSSRVIELKNERTPNNDPMTTVKSTPPSPGWRWRC